MAAAVGRGELAFGLTDTDDAIVELDEGQPVEIVYPDQGPDGMGTLFIPNTVAVLRGAPHPDAARQLLARLLEPDVETQLATGPSAQFPMNRQVSVRSRAQGPGEIRAVAVDWAAAADQWESAARFLRDEFSRP